MTARMNSEPLGKGGQENPLNPSGIRHRERSNPIGIGARPALVGAVSTPSARVNNSERMPERTGAVLAWSQEMSTSSDADRPLAVAHDRGHGLVVDRDTEGVAHSDFDEASGSKCLSDFGAREAVGVFVGPFPVPLHEQPTASEACDQLVDRCGIVVEERTH